MRSQSDERQSDKNRWSDKQLRDYVRRAHSYSCWDSSGDDEREVAHERFRHEVRQRIVPGVQALLLSTVGSLADPEGISVVTEELIDDYGREDERRWLMVSPEPWNYLTAWVASDLVKSYRGARGARSNDSKALKRIEKQSEPSA
jgi:hypothetical protein